MSAAACESALDGMLSCFSAAVTMTGNNKNNDSARGACEDFMLVSQLPIPPCAWSR